MSDKPQQIPSVGRIVHYVGSTGAHYAATITQVDNIGLMEPFISAPEVSLCVMKPDAIGFHQCVPFDPAGDKSHTWHWPEFVPNK